MNFTRNISIYDDTILQNNAVLRIYLYLKVKDQNIDYIVL